MGENPWVYIGITILVAVAVIIGLSTVISLLVAAAAKGFAKKTMDTFRSETASKLPGKNCGDCGYESCEVYAEAVLRCEAPENACPHGGAELPDALIDSVNRLHAIAEDPTPIKKKRRFWDRF